MHIRHASDLVVVLLLCATIECLNDDTKYFEIESNEKKLEYDNRPTPSLPEGESYVIGVKRALLPFRQLSKYLKRPLGDPRSANGVQSVQYHSPPSNDFLLTASDAEQKTVNHKRWDKNDGEAPDGDVIYPEIILIRPINISKLGASKINNINKGLEDAMNARRNQQENLKSSEDTTKIFLRQQNPVACTENQKKVKIDHQIFQGNGINIKLTFSVDVGNQSKPLENKTMSINPKGTTKAARKYVHHSK